MDGSLPCDTRGPWFYCTSFKKKKSDLESFFGAWPERVPAACSSKSRSPAARTPWSDPLYPCQEPCRCEARCPFETMSRSHRSFEVGSGGKRSRSAVRHRGTTRTCGGRGLPKRTPARVAVANRPDPTEPKITTRCEEIKGTTPGQGNIGVPTLLLLCLHSSVGIHAYNVLEMNRTK